MNTQGKIKEEKNQYYFYHLSGGKRTDRLDKSKFILYLRSLFFNETTSKWLPSKYKSFIKIHDLDYSKCYIVLLSLNTNNTILKKKGYTKFLKNIEKYNKKDQSFNKIKIDKCNKMGFLSDLEGLRHSYFKITGKRYIDFIYANFDTGYTKNTLTRKYYDKELDKKTS